MGDLAESDDMYASLNTKDKARLHQHIPQNSMLLLYLLQEEGMKEMLSKWQPPCDHTQSREIFYDGGDKPITMGIAKATEAELDKLEAWIARTKPEMMADFAKGKYL